MPKKQINWIGRVADPFYFFGIRFGGDIGTDDAKEVINYLEEDEKNTVHIVLSSNGGSAFIATRMVDLLAPYQSRITMEVAGLAASAGSLLAMAVPNELYVRDASMVMIHGPYDYTEGTLQQHKNTVQKLEGIIEVISNIYRNNSNLTKSEIEGAVDNELWLTPTQMVEKGVAAKILKPNKKIAAIMADLKDKNEGDRGSILLNFPIDRVAAALKTTENPTMEGSMPPEDEQDKDPKDTFKQDKDPKDAPTQENTPTQVPSLLDDLPETTDGEAALKTENVQLRILVETLEEENRELRKKISTQGKTNQVSRNKESLEEALRTGRIMPSDRKKWEERLEKGGELLRKTLMQLPPSEFFLEHGVAYDEDSIEAVPSDVRETLEAQGYSKEEIIKAYKESA